MTNKIDINKRYRTREGDEVRIYQITSKNVMYPVLGSFKFGGEWSDIDWNIFGRYFDGEEHHFDLIEVVEEKESDND